jgi:hypothetical protein
MVAIVVPLSLQAKLSPDEEISLRHLRHFLGRYDKFLVAPKSLTPSYPGFAVETFSDKYFGSAKAHAELQLAEHFYKRFDAYRYILMYHLDSLVFSDQLMQWCETDLDYIGAPWITCKDTPFVKTPRVGNSGFALIKIEGFLNVFHSDRYTIDPDEYWARAYSSEPWRVRALAFPKKYLKRLRYFNGARWEMARWTSRTDGRHNADYFWSDEASKYNEQFRIPSVEVGLRFAFEVAPRLCFEMNNRQLPFGCHAWARYDRSFWEPYLLK